MPRTLSIICAFFLSFAVFTSPSHAIPTTYTITPIGSGGLFGSFVVDIDGTIGTISATSYSFTDPVFGTITDSGPEYINNVTRDGSTFGISAATIFGQDPSNFSNVFVVNSGPVSEGSLFRNSFNGAGIGTISKAAASVPEPGAMALLGFGLVGLGVVRRRQKHRLG